MPDLLWRLLPRIDNDNAKGEYYLTDLVDLAVGEGAGVALVECPESEVHGVNTRAQLAAIEAVLQQRYREAAMERRRDADRARNRVLLRRHRARPATS